MNQKIINICERIVSFIIIILIISRKIPIIGVGSYFFFKIMGVEIPMSVKVGRNVKLVHWANGLVVHPNTIIEDNVRIYQGVTLGRANIHKPINESKMKGIHIMEGAILCAGSKILCKEGTLVVGRNSIIAANAVLLTSTGDNEIWGGVPAKKIGIVSGK